uniref:integrin alpha-M-like n=1 Tax=Myxine glutinosa TaxID=7769 RepID=UPI00358E8187
MTLVEIVTSLMGPPLCILILTVSWTCNSFNLDTTRPTIYLGNQSENFGYRVLSHEHPAGSSWVIISAPTTKEEGYGELGRIYKCLMTTENLRGSCEALPVPEKTLNLHLGLSLGSNNDHPAFITACGPTGEISCKDNTFLRTSCFTYNGRLEHVDTFHLGSINGCAPKPVDIVVLLDGSSSVLTDEFIRGKDFISNLVADARTRNAQVAVAQYSSRFKKEFDFRNFSQSADPTRLVEQIQHMRGGTMTATAMLSVLKKMFLPEVGARPRAKKVLLVITDGQTYDGVLFKDVTKEAEKKDVIRFAVGSGG